MFEDIKKCLDEYEKTMTTIIEHHEITDLSQESIILNIELNLAVAILNNRQIDSTKLAKIILAAKE